ncbi:MAG: ROK family protein, partial [Oscillospiraceae bacterium]|nr:ROK family protein [Oscillospiraceae bacterium]
ADPKEGLWVYACFSGISDYPIRRRMEERFGLSVQIENDVNACAWAEKIYGGCRDCDDFLWVTVSNGVGGGLVLNGRIYDGAYGGGGEFGHIIVEDGGRLCPCGHKGCMEAMAAGPGISARYEDLTGIFLSGGEIATLARGGDPVALRVIRDTGKYIGKGLGKAASLLNLRKYVLGGGVMQSYDLMEEDILSAFRSEAFERPNAKAEICLTSLGYNAALLGAAAIFFSSPKNQ